MNDIADADQPDDGETTGPDESGDEPRPIFEVPEGAAAGRLAGDGRAARTTATTSAAAPRAPDVASG